ncbi:MULTISPECIES: AraC family transcriptional regulator [unclassified Mesorhizobium]|uniref:AraC family transcriptional regulator n=1 Tax=unclassified Mesorhizobium TaxID=325217 RepID=UPI000FCBB30F|nr:MULTISPECIES: AraC family transcriptional regulator [unclassified Mesorhizobium]TGP21696.1 AraC family transcriptional regulator [Mesorhizobium sp. M1D.F.Ca.ET.231.01.1.1]TGP29797.1 AraC family transcriptional regulator [Mesorhizobium sp. M1D.F.Ca.ET.234.01.1.1]TGS44161.1 AraC family transcriptional regulator [Mesorhizobium sp. M1D.F.Ca.ET.184.01.1.1]TGS60181.1 AraC family transcriptional regulator [Mesorhizobium sp. M1D.F.Ca.ET.183.01.1.1]
MSNASEQREREAARLTRHEGLGGLEMLAAHYRDYAYSLHTHPTWVFGVVVAGVEKLRIGQRQHLAPAGTIIIVNPEEPHDGERGEPAGWAYRTCYPDAALMAEIAEDLDLPTLPMFGKGTVEAPELARAFVRAHRLAGQALEQEAAMLAVLRELVSRFGNGRHRDRAPDGGETARRFRLYGELMAADLAAGFDLAHLAAAAGVTRFRVIRDFHRAAGMTPGQYLRDRRIRAASALIKTDMPLAEIAAATGFADQSHLTRVFKTIKGLSPGAWRAAA